MYIFGLLIYIGIPVMTYVFAPARALVAQCFSLSPEITFLIVLTYFYPLTIFVYSYVRKFSDAGHFAYFRSQVNLASSFAVSFGLIGTFIGLSQMIAGIAMGMGADGDFSEKMEALLGSIGLALDSMSFAFLTSIMGVSCSVSVMIASNYLNSFFEKELVQGENSSGGPSGAIDGISEEQQQVINENFNRMQQSIDNTIQLINSKDKVWTDLYTLLENNSGSTVVQSFSNSLAENNRLVQQQSDQVQRIYDEQAAMYQKMDSSLSDHAQHMQHQTDSVSGAVTSISSEMDRVGQIIQQTSDQTNEAISSNNQVIERMNRSFNDALTSNNEQLNQTVAENNQAIESIRAAFSDALSDNNDLLNQTFSENSQAIEGIRSAFSEALADNHDLLNQTIGENNQAIERIRAAFNEALLSSNQQLSQTIDENNQTIERVNAAFSEALHNTNTELNSVAEILDDIRLATAMPLEESLGVALRDNAFNLEFQPQVDEQKTVVGAESYIRWIEPVRGMIPNGTLFKLAKKEGVSIQLELWVMRNTIQQVSLWQQKGMWKAEWTVSINATSDLLLAPTFITDVEKMVKTYNVLPGSIAFEVTEDVIMQHNAQAKDKIRQLHNMGMKLYIDNFGEGYTNISHLSEFQPDRLKLARNIVNNLSDSSETGIAVVRSVMSVAQQLDITVSADGVETEEQFELLKAEGCHLFQGWYFEKPLDVEAFENKLIATDSTVTE